jgi:hypothetical protein
MSPQHVVIVTIDLEQVFEFVYVALGWEDALEVAHTGQLLLGLKQNQPVLRAQDLKTSIVVQLL